MLVKIVTLNHCGVIWDKITVVAASDKSGKRVHLSREWEIIKHFYGFLVQFRNLTYGQGLGIHGKSRKVLLLVGEAKSAGCSKEWVSGPLEWDACCHATVSIVTT